MVAGLQNNPKVAFIIQARMKSVRLPGKVLMPIPLNNGKPLIQWIVDELRSRSLNSKIILATSTNIENNVLADYCSLHSIECYRGHEENVLSRFIEIAKSEKFDVIVRLTGDNPLVDISLLNKAIRYHLSSRNDYTYTAGLPLGMNFEIICPSALLGLEKVVTTIEEKEHVTLFLRSSGKYKTGLLNLAEDLALKDLRLTIDYPSDFLVVSQVLEFCKNGLISKINAIEKILKEYPWVFCVNLNNTKKNIK